MCVHTHLIVESDIIPTKNVTFNTPTPFPLKQTCQRGLQIDSKLCPYMQHRDLCNPFKLKIKVRFEVQSCKWPVKLLDEFLAFLVSGRPCHQSLLLAESSSKGYGNLSRLNFPYSFLMLSSTQTLNACTLCLIESNEQHISLYPIFPNVSSYLWHSLRQDILCVKICLCSIIILSMASFCLMYMTFFPSCTALFFTNHYFQASALSE